VNSNEEGLNTAKEALESVADKVEDKVEEIAQKIETEVEDAFSAFEGKLENIENEIDNTFTNKDVEDIALNTGEFIGILGEEWNSTDSNELKELPQLQEEFEDNIKSDASDLWKLYSKNNPDGAKTITNAIEDVAIAKKDLELGWEEYKQEDPLHAGMIAGTYDFAKGLIVGTFKAYEKNNKSKMRRIFCVRQGGRFRR
jgi:tetrahydromethanopterin S-methyltransferase subunit G